MTALGVPAGRHDVVAIFRPPTPSKNDLVMCALAESGFLGEPIVVQRVAGFNGRRSRTAACKVSTGGCNTSSQGGAGAADRSPRRARKPGDERRRAGDVRA